MSVEISSIKYIIFDFDGTIADTLTQFIEVANKLAPVFNYKTISDLDEIRNKTSKEIIKYLCIPLLKIPFLLKRIKDDFSTRINEVRPFDNIAKVLIDLKDEGYKLYILSSNNKDNVKNFLIRYDINFFEDIAGDCSLFGKYLIINRLLKKHHIPTKQAIYVGDEVRDIQAAHKSKIRVISVGWGFSSPKVLAKYHPDFIAETPLEILEIINSQNSKK